MLAIAPSRSLFSAAAAVADQRRLDDCLQLAYTALYEAAANEINRSNSERVVRDEWQRACIIIIVSYVYSAAELLSREMWISECSCYS